MMQPELCTCPQPVRQLTPQELLAEIQRLAAEVRAQIERLEQLKRVSPETMRTEVTI